MQCISLRSTTSHRHVCVHRMHGCEKSAQLQVALRRPPQPSLATICTGCNVLQTTFLVLTRTAQQGWYYSRCARKAQTNNQDLVVVLVFRFITMNRLSLRECCSSLVLPTPTGLHKSFSALMQLADCASFQADVLHGIWEIQQNVDIIDLACDKSSNEMARSTTQSRLLLPRLVNKVVIQLT